MFKPKAYKSMLAASVLTAVMGTGSDLLLRYKLAILQI